MVPSGAHHGHLQQGPSPLLPAWLEFSTMPARASTLGNLRTGATPLMLPELPVRAHGSSASGSTSSSISGSSAGVSGSLEGSSSSGNGSKEGEAAGGWWRFWRRRGGEAHPEGHEPSGTEGHHHHHQHHHHQQPHPHQQHPHHPGDLQRPHHGSLHSPGGLDFAHLDMDMQQYEPGQLKLTNEGGFLPRSEVLQRSDFLAPLPDEDTRRFYHWLLE